MEFHGIDDFMRYLKVKFDESERKQDWRALTGRHHVHGQNDTFIFTDRRVYQIKSVEIAPHRMAAVGREVGRPSPDMLGLIRGGAPIPLSVVSRPPDAYPVIMFGLQQYSSEVADLFRNEYFSSKQDDLQRDLKHQLGLLLERSEFRSSYRKIKESQESYFG